MCEHTGGWWSLGDCWGRCWDFGLGQKLSLGFRIFHAKLCQILTQMFQPSLILFYVLWSLSTSVQWGHQCLSAKIHTIVLKYMSINVNVMLLSCYLRVIDKQLCNKQLYNQHINWHLRIWGFSPTSNQTQYGIKVRKMYYFYRHIALNYSRGIINIDISRQCETDV